MKIRKNIALSDTGFLFNPSTGDSYSLNPTAREIVQMMQEEKPEEEIVKTICENYMIDEASVEKDFYDFKSMLQNYKLTE